MWQAGISLPRYNCNIAYYDSTTYKNGTQTLQRTTHIRERNQDENKWAGNRPQIRTLYIPESISTRYKITAAGITRQNTINVQMKVLDLRTTYRLIMVQHAQLSRSPSRGILIGSPNSPLNSSVSSCARALCAITGIVLDNLTLHSGMEGEPYLRMPALH